MLFYNKLLSLCSDYKLDTDILLSLAYHIGVAWGGGALALGEVPHPH